MQPDARLAADIGTHAANEALATMLRIIGTMPDEAIRPVALTAAFALIEVKGRVALEIFGPKAAALYQQALTELLPLEQAKAKAAGLLSKAVKP